MTNKTKTLSVVFAITALLMVAPLTNQVANATGDASTDPECPVTIPGTFAMGNIVPGADTTQTSEFTMATPGNVDGTLELKAGDWLGVGTKASAVVVLTNVIATDTITVNGQLMTATAIGTAGADEFDVGATDAITATNLAAKLTSEAQVETIATDDPTGVATENVVIIRSNVLGAGGNAMTVATADTTFTVPATLSDGEAIGVKHAESTMTKFLFTSDGSSSQGTPLYSGKTAALVDTDTQIVIPRTDVAQDVKVTFQVSGDGTLLALPYSGALQQSLVFTVTCVAA